MDKQEIISKIILYFQKEIETYERISAQAREDAISSENKQEGKYDTRAIEASYLAGAQKRRHEELLVEVQKLKSLDLDNLPQGKISLASLLKLDDGDSESYYFLSPSSGGFEVVLNSQVVRIVSVSSPIARSMVSLEEGERHFSLKLPAGIKEYKIVKIF